MQQYMACASKKVVHQKPLKFVSVRLSMEGIQGVSMDVLMELYWDHCHDHVSTWPMNNSFGLMIRTLIHVCAHINSLA